MIIVGLTGGIGSGKSTVSAALARRGAIVIDADAITKELQEPGQAVFAEIVDRFGQEVVGPDGSLDRQRLADLIFTDTTAKQALEAIVHPAVGAEIVARLDGARNTDDLVVLDVPLLVETGRTEKLLDSLGLGLAGLVVVDTSPVLALERLVDQRGMSEQDVSARMAHQATRDERLARADFVIENNGTRNELDVAIEHCWSWLSSLVAVPPSANA